MLIQSIGDGLRLDPDISVDLHQGLRLARVHALEDASRRLLDAGPPGVAVVLAARAVAAESLRDSAHSTLIRAFEAEGNHSKAVEQYRRYTELLQTELGVQVSLSFAEILQG